LFLGFTLGLIVVLFLFSERKKHYPRWPERTSTLSSIPSRKPQESFESSAKDRDDATLTRIAGAMVLRGRLLDSVSRDPVAGAVLSLHDNPDSATQADQEGLFILELEKVTSSPAVVLIDGEGYPRSHLTVEEIPDKMVDIFLYKEVKLSALVADDVSVAPIQGAQVSIQQTSGLVSALTNAEGLTGPVRVNPFLKLGREADGSFRSHLESLRVAAEAENYERLQTDVGNLGEATQVLLRLRPVKALLGAVVDLRGLHVPGAVIVSRWAINVGKDTSELGSSRTSSDDHGLFELKIPSGKDGSLQVGAAREGYGPTVLGLDLQLQPSRDRLVLTLPPGYKLEGIVSDRKGNGLEGVRISLNGEEMKEISSLRTGHSNRLGDDPGTGTWCRGRGQVLQCESRGRVLHNRAPG
jgi:hypothetical protein